MPERFTFLPHAQSGMAALATAPGAGEARLKLTYEFGIEKGGQTQGARVPVSSAVRGPGDVHTIDRSAISRVEPRPGLRGFEPNYFPAIEFGDADFPWRFSLDTGSASRKIPWLALIVLEAGEFSFVQSGRSTLKRIQVKDGSLSLPDPAFLWASAHVQANIPDTATGTAAQNAQAVLESDADGNFARIMCLRKLKPVTSYHGFLVPVYEAGRLSGLGQTDTASPYDAFAWGLAAGPVDLPTYFDWRFTTDAQEDVELLLRRLKALDLDDLADLIGDTGVSAQTPGYYDMTFPKATFARQSAMQVPREDPPEIDTPKGLVPPMIDTLTEVMTGAKHTEDKDEDPLVAFPPYGFRYKPETGISYADAKRRAWFDQINLDLKFRQVAGLGTKLVRRNQEMFAHLAWTQFDEIVEANEKLARLQAAQKMAEALTTRHFERLPSDVSLALSQGLHRAVEVVKGTSVSQRLAENGVPLSSSARSLRHVAAKRSVALSGRGPEARDSVPMPSAPGDTSAALRGKSPSEDAPGPTAKTLKDPAFKGKLSVEIGEMLRPIFNMDIFEGLKEARVPTVAVRRFSSADLVAPVANMLARLPVYKSLVSIRGLTKDERKTVRPVWRAPEIAYPMSGLLQQVSQTALFAGAQNLPDNSVAVVEENRPFVEAFLLGMNHEMNRELRWREFPTDMRGTIFRRFWDRGHPRGDPRGDDIAPIHQWQARLGGNVPGAAGNARENLIVVIRGDIVRKLGDPVLAINIAEEDDGFKVGKGRDIPPSFVGKIGGDTSYFGFEISREEVLDPSIENRVFFVIYEPAGRLRFGLDVGSLAVRQARRDEAVMTYGFRMKGMQDRPYRPQLPFEGRKRAVQVDGAPPLSQIQGWDELSWAHLVPLATGYIDVSQNKSVPLSPNHLGASKTSASMARAFWQKPVAGVLPLKRVL